MSESSKPQRPGATPIKNPLLSASVTGLTFDDFPNKPFLLPAAPPIVHAPPPPTPTAVGPPSALLGREHKSLVTLGSSSLDTENLDEINLNSSNEDNVTSGASDPNANPLLEQPPTTDSILSQAASSFSALPSVASNVFSSFSKRITAISSRETTPIYDQSSSDANGNYTVPQLDIQPTYTQQHLPLAPEPFYAPQPAPPQSGSYFGSFPPPSSGIEDIQNIIPPLEPPKFYIPGEVTTLPTAPAVPPPIAGGQNNFRLSAKKKLYAPIPGLSDQSQQPAPTFDPTAVSAPISYDQSVTAPFPQQSYPHEERKTVGGLFSKITNLAPVGVLQNITGLVQSAAGTKTQTVKPDSSHSCDQQHFPTGITFDQQPSNYFAGPPQTAAAPLVGQGAFYPSPPTFAPNQPPPTTGAPLFNPHSSGDLSLSAAVVPGPQPAEITFFDPSKGPAVYDPTKQILNPFETAPPPSQPSGYFQDPYQQGPVAPPPSAASSQPSRPPSYPSRPPSQPGIPVFAQQPTQISFFNPSQVAPDVLQVPSLSTTLTNTTSPSQVGVFNPTTYLPAQPTPVQPLVPPPVAAALPPPSGGQTSFRLQKGTRLYKNPLTAEETAPVQVVPNQIAPNPAFPNSQQAFAPPTLAPQQSFAPPPLASNHNVGQVPLVPPQGVYDLNAHKQFSQSVVPSTITQVSNIFVASAEPQSCSLFAPTTAQTPKCEDNKTSDSIPLFAAASAGELKSGSEHSVPLFTAAIEETGIQSGVSLLSAPTAEVKKAEDPKAEVVIERTQHQVAPENLQPAQSEKEQLAEVNNSAYFFQPIDPVAESLSNQQETKGSSVNFFGTNEQHQQLLQPIEPIVEEQKVIAELQQNQNNTVDTLEEALQKVFLNPEDQSAPNKSEVAASPSAANASLESAVPNLPTIPVSLPPTSDTLSTAEPKALPLVPPPSVQSSLGISNPYRRGSASETTKPSVVQPTLANFFTPDPGTTSTGDFNFFSTLPSAQEVSVQPTKSDFFSTQASQQSGDCQNFFGTSQVDNKLSEASNPVLTTNFFAAETKPSTSSIVAGESSPPQAPATNSQNIIASADCSNKFEAVGVEPQQSSSIFGTTPYPCDTSTHRRPITACFPLLPTNIGIIPSVQENIENIEKHQGEINLQSQALPPPPIGFENFVQTQNKSQLDTVPKPPTAAKLVQPQASSINQSQGQTLQSSDTHPLASGNTTQQVISTAATQQQQQQQQQLPVVNSFSNYFNQNATTKPEIAKDPSAFFDSLAGQPQLRQATSDLLPSTQVPASNEDQVIQNFFNNPPPKDAYHAGDLNYDLIHSGLAIRNLQQRSLTPVSNLVEPPSSACSEFSNLTLDASTADTSITKEDTKVEHSSAAAVDTSIKHCEELPEEVLKELRMATLLQGDKVATTTPPASVSYKPVVKHWFYKRSVDGKQLWTPFSHYDSALLETSLTMEGDDKPSIVAVEGGRYDVNISERLKRSIYWESEPIEIRRCSWFYKAIDSKYIPYEESTADILEADYKHAAESGAWHKTIILSMGEQVVFHGPTVIVHYQQQHNQDAWGGTTQTTTRPRVVKRDLDDFRIEQGESQKVDHLLFMVHGIGSACDLKLRSVEEVVHDFRSIAHQLVQSHYKNSADLGLVGRVEVLPISWHNHLHSLEEGIDEKLRAITLESIPKLRNFTNDTLLDILFYTSPTFAQKIMNSIVMSLNDIYVKYRQRHPEFNGGVSLAGHSLGSLILFDLLCNQNPIKECEEKNLENPDQQFMTTDNNAATSSTAAGRMHLDSNQMESKQISYTMGPAGTGQPFINYGQLIFQPKKFFALGSPIGMFVTIRGIDKLGLDFRLPTCTGFYNIFHPYDPVAYRIEALVNPELSGARPVLIPHHKGRKRMHLELKETMARVSTDLKNKFLDKFKNTFDSVNIFGTTTKTKKEAEELMEKEVEKVIEMQMQLERQDQPQQSKTQQSQELISPSDEHLLTPTPTQTLRSRTDSLSTVISDDVVEIDLPLGKLNDSKRIDYVLQEAPLEFINEYIFALSSHVCYWDSEDTILFVMKEIYSGLGISPDSQVPQQTMTIERPSSRNSLSNS